MPESTIAKRERTIKVINKLRIATRSMERTAATQIVAEFGRDPFLVLVGCILSLRTKDSVSLPASRRLFQLAKTPHDLVRLSLSQIQKAIYPVGFYRQKSQQLHDISAEIIERFGGTVPSSEDDLLAFKGVGRKTMNLVLGEGFGVPAICVDTHVHRISNRLGLVNTKTPEETENMLKKVLPKKHWTEFNRLLVIWGQNICAPISPFCSRCLLARRSLPSLKARTGVDWAVAYLCPKKGVIRKR